jgi:hypothetical protein
LGLNEGTRINSGLLYSALLLGQTVAALSLFWLAFPIFSWLVTHLGERQNLRLSDQIAIALSALLLHCLYWARLRWVSVVAPCHNIVVSHLCAFASRISFFFGGALFSAVFFRHLPELEILPPLGQTIAQSLYIAAILFGLFCYSLELDRLAKAIEEPATGKAGT